MKGKLEEKIKEPTAHTVFGVGVEQLTEVLANSYRIPQGC